MTNLSKLLVGVVVTMMLCAYVFSAPTVLDVKKSGGTFSTIQSALNGAAALPPGTGAVIVEVQDNGTYTENLEFTTSSLTLRAATGNTPKIVLSGSTPTNTYIGAAPFTGGDTIDGFTIEFSGEPAGPNLFMVLGIGNIRNCVIDGKGATTGLRAFANAASVTNVEVKGCAESLIYDDGGVNAVLTNVFVHNNSNQNTFNAGTITLNNCNFSTNTCQLYLGDNTLANVTANNSTFAGSQVGRRNIEMKGSKTLSFNGCLIKDAYNDDVLIQNGTVSFSRSIVQTPDHNSLNPFNDGRAILCVHEPLIGNTTPVTVTIDHCDIAGDLNRVPAGPYNQANDSTFTMTGVAFAIANLDTLATVTMTNSIVIGNKGIQKLAGVQNFISLTNDIVSFPIGAPTAANYNGWDPLMGESDPINYHTDPVYAEINNPADPFFFKYSPTASVSQLGGGIIPLAQADETGQFLGSRGPTVILNAASDWSLYN